MNYNEFEIEFSKIKNKWHKTTKPNNINGGQGNTLENLLGIKENNISAPDLGKIELKTINISDGSSKSRLISLFTFNSKVWKMDQLEAIRRYGSLNKDGRMGMYYTLTTVPNSKGLFIWLDDDRIQVRNIDGTIILDYSISTLVERFNKKIGDLILIYSERKGENGTYYYKYLRGIYYRGETTENMIRQLFKQNIIKIDLRLYPRKKKESNKESSRNHGTGFRIQEKDIIKLYRSSKEIK